MTDHRTPTMTELTEALLEEGAIWFARMRGPDRDDFRREFEQWLQSSTLHEAAYARAGEIFAAGRFLAVESATRNRVANDNVQRGGESWKWLAVAAVVGLGIAMIAVVLQQRSMGVDGDAAFHSAAQGFDDTQKRQYVGGEVSTPIRLSDGSLVTLAPGSVLTQAYGAERRQLLLEKGGARFEVAHEGRPFVVEAGGGSVTARGTIFDVRLTENRQVTVNLLRGAIDVARPRQSDGSSPPFSRLVAGESVAFSSHEAPPSLQASAGAPSTLDEVTGTSKPREFDRTPLSAVIAETRAASGMRIVVADPSVAQMRVSGRFRVDDGQQVVERLSALFGLEIDTSPSGEITLRQEN